MNTPFWISYAVLWVITVFIVFLLFIVIRQFGIVYLKTADGVSRGGLQVGVRIPQVEFQTLKGTTQRIGMDRAQLVVFTAPHCAPCRLLKPHIAEFASLRSDIQVIVVSVDSSPSEAEDYVRGLPEGVVGIRLPDQKLYQTIFLGEVTPFAYMVNQNGVITGKGLVNDIEQLQGIASTIPQFQP